MYKILVSNKKIKNIPELQNFKKAIASLILAQANYLRDQHHLEAPPCLEPKGKFWVFGVPRWLENAFPSLVPQAYQCAKAPYLLYYVPQNIHSPASLKKPTLLQVQLPVQISVTSNVLKGYLCYKTITSQNVSSEAQIKNFFISQKNYVPFLRYSNFCIFNHPMIYRICDVMMSISTQDKVHF